MFTEKNSSYYQSQLADIKEDVIIRIMKLMRGKGYNSIKDPKNCQISYRIVEEPRGGKTLASFIGAQMMSYTRAATPVEKLLDILEIIEKAQEAE